MDENRTIQDIILNNNITPFSNYYKRVLLIILMVIFSGSCRIVPFDISSCVDDGKFHGTESFLGLAAQQFQFRRTQIEERGKPIEMEYF